MKNNIESTYIEGMLARTVNNRLLAIDLFEKLFLELPKQMLEIETAVRQQNWSLAKKNAHQVHGSTSFCGLSELAILSGHLENALLDNNTQEINHFLRLLIQEVNIFSSLKEIILQKLNRLR